jgi:hypothetical protein
MVFRARCTSKRCTELAWFDRLTTNGVDGSFISVIEHTNFKSGFVSIVPVADWRYR